MNFQQAIHHLIEGASENAAIASTAKWLVGADTAALAQRRGVTAREVATEYVRVARDMVNAGGGAP